MPRNPRSLGKRPAPDPTTPVASSSVADDAIAYNAIDAWPLGEPSIKKQCTTPPPPSLPAPPLTLVHAIVQKPYWSTVHHLVYPDRDGPQHADYREVSIMRVLVQRTYTTAPCGGCEQRHHNPIILTYESRYAWTFGKPGEMTRWSKSTRRFCSLNCYRMRVEKIKDDKDVRETTFLDTSNLLELPGGG